MQFLAQNLLTDSGFSRSGIAVTVGGPLLVQYIRPTDEELIKRYNPDLQKRSMEQGERKAQEFDEYVNKLKEWSKSDKSSMSYSACGSLVTTAAVLLLVIQHNP